MKLVGRVPVSDLPIGRKLRLPYPPYDVLVVNLAGTPYAMEDACNHAGASLSEGRVKGCEIICPMHGYVFDVRSGTLVIPEGLCDDQRTFEVVREGDEWAVYDPVDAPLSTGFRP